MHVMMMSLPSPLLVVVINSNHAYAGCGVCSLRADGRAHAAMQLNDQRSPLSVPNFH